MTTPRFVPRGSTWLVTRRCVGRQFLIKPAPFVNELVRYALALAAQRTGVEIHAFQFLSNHYHLVVTDPDAQLPEFVRHLNNTIARGINRQLGRSGAVWSNDRFSGVRLLDRSALVSKIAYTLNNVVAAGLVKSPDQWPGVTSSVDQMGREFTTTRPDGAFSPLTQLVEEPRLRLTMPRCPMGGFAADLLEDVRVAVEKNRTEILSDRLERELEFLGPIRALAVSHHDSARVAEKRDELSPTVACGDSSMRKTALAALRNFRQQYRSAWRRFRSGVADVVFPYGTWSLHYRFGFRTEVSPQTG